ncbi:copper resistance protein NlpE [Tenacibaculum maritimum]|uniref:copper resistance protein NlpE n=1 Tax=Tenacibaculum maritimum TaxID=107401 RepID=UPI0013300835|nr:copper resistance protein NlpE [Tenacibaculum maritimum]
MHHFFYILIISLFFSSCKTNKQKEMVAPHSTEYALDYEGLYKGTFPCADCSGIQVSLLLTKNNTFRYETTYLGKGHYIEKGNYSVKEKILTLKESNRSIYFLIGKNRLSFLGEDLKAATGQFASYYELKKQQEFNFIGAYETFNESKGGYTNTLSIQPKGKNFDVQFSASKVNGFKNCNFKGIAHKKNDTLWVNIAHKSDNEAIQMYIAPSHDNLGVEVFTSDFEKRFTMMFYCGGGGSIAGNYMKNTITDNSIGVFNNQTTISKVLHQLPLAQIQKKEGYGEFKDAIYDDYEISRYYGEPLFTITPKDTGNVHQKINRVLVLSPFFKTEKGITKHATYGAIKKAYTIDKMEPTKTHIVLIVDEINASFSILKSELNKGWWDDTTNTIDSSKIPLDAKIDDFVLWWNK